MVLCVYVSVYRFGGQIFALIMTFSFVQQTNQWQKFRLRVVSAFPKFHRATGTIFRWIIIRFRDFVWSDGENFRWKWNKSSSFNFIFLFLCVFCRSILRTFVQQLEVTWCRIPSPSTTPTMRNEAIKEINHHFVFVEWRKWKEILFRSENFFRVGAGADRSEVRVEQVKVRGRNAFIYYKFVLSNWMETFIRRKCVVSVVAVCAFLCSDSNAHGAHVRNSNSPFYSRQQRIMRFLQSNNVAVRYGSLR